MSVAPQFIDYIDAFIKRTTELSALHSPVLSRFDAPAEEGQVATESYALQFRAPSQAELKNYEETFLPILFNALYGAFGEKVMYFTTVLEVIR